MDDFTDIIEKGLKNVPQATKVSRAGILSEKIFLLYSQERIASYGLQPGDLPKILSARNITPAGGQLEAVGRNFSINPSGEFKSEKEIDDVAISRTEQGAPVYLRDVVDVERGYDPAEIPELRESATKRQLGRSRAIGRSQMRRAETSVNSVKTST
jgi:multidrug efflux pump subunit AcrB